MRALSLVLIILLGCFGCSRKSKENLYAEGVRQLQGSNPGGAVVYFKTALERDANFLDARFQLAKAYAALGKFSQAEKELMKVLKQNPSRDEATLELAKVANASGKGEQASQLAGRYLARHPDDPSGLEVLGLSFGVQKRYQDGILCLQKALRNAPKPLQVKVELASLYASDDEREKAKVLLDEVLGRDLSNVRALYLRATLLKKEGFLDEAVADYNRILQVDGNQIQALYKLGLIQVEKGDLDRAQQTADRIVTRFPKRGDGYRLRGIVSYSRKRYPEAIDSLQSSLKWEPTLEAYHFLGLSYYSTGQLESALSQFRVILDRIPSARQPRLMTGLILSSLGRSEDAIAEIKKVLAVNEGDAVAHNLLGGAYMSQGLFEEGMRELNRATALDPAMVAAHLKKGIFYLNAGKEHEGEMELATAVQVAPGLLNSRLLLASYYQRQKKGAKALALLQAGLTGGKGDAPIYNAISVLQFRSGDRAAGVASLQLAQKLDPDFASSYDNLAAYYAASGDYRQAMAQLQSLLLRNPRQVKALLGLAVLNEIYGTRADALAYYRKATLTGAPEAFLALAGFHQKKGESGEAIKVLDEAIRVNPRAIAPLEMKGRVLLARKKYRDAVKVFDEAELLNQDAGVTLKITAYCAMGDGVRAVEQARRLVARHPKSARGYLVLASVYESQKDFPSAFAEVRNGIRADARSVEPRVFLGHLHESRGEYAHALAAYRDALALDPASVSALFARGAVLERIGRKQEAAGSYRAILAKSDAFAPALNNLAYLCAEGYGSPQEALRLALQAFRLDPGNPSIMDTVGFALLKNGRSNEAIKVLEKAQLLLPTDKTVAYHLGLAYRDAGTTKAGQTLKR